MSAALDEWNGNSREALDDVEALYGRVEGTSAGSRMLTRQVNYAYATLILAHFQRTAAPSTPRRFVRSSRRS
jgi:hypothetical protein